MKLDDWKPTFTIGCKSYYGIKLTNSNIKGSLTTNDNNVYMKYLAAFHFPTDLQMEIVGKVHEKLRGKDEKISQAILVMNSTAGTNLSMF